MRSLCQLCGASEDTWRIHQALLHLGRIQNWKIQMCEGCTDVVEHTLLAALKHLVVKSEGLPGTAEKP